MTMLADDPLPMRIRAFRLDPVETGLHWQEPVQPAGDMPGWRALRERHRGWASMGLPPHSYLRAAGAANGYAEASGQHSRNWMRNVQSPGPSVQTAFCSPPPLPVKCGYFRQEISGDRQTLHDVLVVPEEPPPWWREII